MSAAGLRGGGGGSGPVAWGGGAAWGLHSGLGGAGSPGSARWARRFALSNEKLGGNAASQNFSERFKFSLAYQRELLMKYEL